MRLRLLFIMLAILFSVTATRAVQIQVVQADEMAAQAAKKMTVGRTLPAMRGQITARDGRVLAFTEATLNVVADPKAISTNGKEPEAMREADRTKAAQAPHAIAQIVAKHLGVDAVEAEKKLSLTSSKYQVLARQVPASTYTALATELNEGNWPGISRESNPRRIYPLGTTASNLVGFTSDGTGMAGIEYALNTTLTGTPGRETFETSPHGKIPLGNQVLTPAVDGCSVQLTLDADLQWMVEQRLKQQVDQVSGNWGVAVVLDVETGDVLSLANYPSYDANAPAQAAKADLGNRAVGAAYEPGSVQKLLTVAALLDAGLTTPDTTYHIDKTVQVGDDQVEDAFSHGLIDITTRGIVVRSSNVGAITAARTMDKSVLRDYLVKFGLGAKTGVGLPGEATGSLPKADMPDYARDSIAFGYGLSVTSIQLAAAVGALANDGVLNPPRIVESTTCNGTTTPAERPTPTRVVSSNAAREVVEMMEQKTIYDRRAIWVDGYRTGAKTGTARLVSAEGGYRGQVASIIGVAPVEDPQILVYVLVARPDQMGAGLGMAGPVYRDILSLALPRYGVRPSNGMVETQLPLVR